MNSKLKFLIIDDEQDIIDVLNIYILKYFDDVEIKNTKNPHDAIALVKEGFSPNIVLLDLNMPQLHGMEVVKKLLAINFRLNIIIYTGAIEQLEFINNVQLGIRGVLEKPAGPEELRDEVNRVLAEEEERNNFISYDLTITQLINIWPSDIYVLIGKNKYVKLFNKGDDIDHDKIEKMLSLPHVHYFISTIEQKNEVFTRYIPIDILTIKTTSSAPCDIYSRNTGEYKKIITKNSAIIKEYLDLLFKKNIKQLYIEEQYEKYFAIIPENILVLKINDTELARAERVNALLKYADQKLAELYSDPSEKNILKIDYLSDQIARYLNDDKGALLEILNIKSQHDAKVHAINVATLSTSIMQYFETSIFDENADKKVLIFAKKLSFVPAMKKNIVLAALLHDLETTLHDAKEKNIHVHSNETSQAMKLLSQIRGMPAVVLDIIAQHEERCDGSGPKKFFKVQINIYAHILMVTDQYQIYLSKGKTPQEALAAMFSEKKKYNDAVLFALKSVIVL